LYGGGRGFEVIAGLLGDFIPAVWEHPRSKRAAKLLDLVPDAYLLEEPLQSNNAYEALLGITDFVAGMTDAFAISTYRVLRGIDLPTS
jgi:dGTPase